MAYLNLAFFVFLSNYTTLSVVPALEVIIEEFNITETKANYMITVSILMLGVGVSVLIY